MFEFSLEGYMPQAAASAAAEEEEEDCKHRL